MNSIAKAIFLCLALFFPGPPSSSAARPPAGPVAGAGELGVCGWDEVFIIALRGPRDSLPEKIWSWRAAERQELPDSMKPRFATTDECGPGFAAFSP